MIIVENIKECAHTSKTFHFVHKKQIEPQYQNASKR